MSTPVITVGADAPLKEAARLLVEHAISGLPVVDDFGQVIGLVSESDFLVKESGPAALRHRPLARFIGDSHATEADMSKVRAVTTRDAMTAPVVAIEPDRPIREAAEVMVKRRINRLPVVDVEGRLIGIVTRADIVRAYVRPDRDLEGTIREEILVKTMWVDPDSVELTVVDGVVTVRGTLDRRSSVEILERLIGQVDGVVAVEADLGWQLDDLEISAPEKDLVWPPTNP